MRYHSTDTTLIVRGAFRACSTGTGGGIRNVTTLLNHTVTNPSGTADPAYTIECVARRSGLYPPSVFGLLTAVPMVHLCIIRYDNIIVFITAGITHPDIGRDNEAGPVRTDNSPGTINIICCVEEGMSDQGLLDAIISVTEAKALALAGLGHEFAGTVTDAVIIASEGEGKLQYTGCATSLGLKIHKAVLFGVPKALEMSSRKGTSDTHFEQVFFIYSTISGNRWIEWSKGNCPYYPCHFKGQMCDFCFCPLYPCKDETLGEWTRSSQREGKVWNCAPCTLNHQPAVVRHLRANPQATLLELKSFLKNQDICRNKLT